METLTLRDTPTVQGPAQAMQVAAPKVVVRYERRDISANISPSLLEISYTDFLEGQSDTIELVLEDADRRWQRAWYPQHGDLLEVQLGYEAGALLPCGQFEIDEVELDGPPDVVRIKALAAGVTRALRTRNDRAYENITLAELANTVARRNGMQVSGQIAPVRLERVTQVNETDLAFLKRVAAEYGYSFSVRHGKICLFARAELRQSKPELVIERGDVSSYRFRDKIQGVVKAATVSYHDGRQQQVRRQRVEASADSGARQSADELKLNLRAENAQQAKLKADAALAHSQDDQTSASLTLFGNVRLMAGVNVQLRGFGRMDGKYGIAQSLHRITRSDGYSSQIDLKRVRADAAGAGA